MRSDPAWRLHVGAHKTATTHLQDTLALNRSAIAAEGIGYISRDEVRATGIRPKRRKGLFGMAWGRPASTDAFLRESYPSAGTGVVVLSEELLLGMAPDLLRDPTYPDAEVRLAPFQALSREQPVTLFLSIRSFRDVLPSCYAQALRAHPYPEGSFEEIGKRVSEQPPSWYALAERLRRLFPQSPLVVWTFEAYVADPTGILSAFLGMNARGFELAPQSADVQCPSGRAVLEAERGCRSLGGPARQAAVADIYAAYPRETYGRFDPLSAEQKDVLSAAYRADLERLETIADTRVLNV